jgi:hypothetical protein
MEIEEESSSERGMETGMENILYGKKRNGKVHELNLCPVDIPNCILEFNFDVFCGMTRHPNGKVPCANIQN